MTPTSCSNLPVMGQTRLLRPLSFWVFYTLKDRDCTTFLVPLLDCLHGEKGLPCIKSETFFSIYAHCHLSTHHAQLCKDWLHLLNNPPIGTIGFLLDPPQCRFFQAAHQRPFPAELLPRQAVPSLYRCQACFLPRFRTWQSSLLNFRKFLLSPACLGTSEWQP